MFKDQHFSSRPIRHVHKALNLVTPLILHVLLIMEIDGGSKQDSEIFATLNRQSYPSFTKKKYSTNKRDLRLAAFLQTKPFLK